MIKQIDKYFKEELELRKPSKVVDAMEYSLMSGGKRVRPLLLLNLVKDFGCPIDKKCYYAAMSVELIHTYSLVHDDLPALDNDDLRRFKPTNHIVFGEDIAVLAGDGLLTMGFELLASAELDHRFYKILSKNAGVSGMILGQELDIIDEIQSLDDLLQTYALKTGCLFSSALEMAALLADREEDLVIVQDIAQMLGIAFQIQDDLLEVSGTEELIGKSTSSDQKRNLSTIMSFMSEKEADKYLDDLFDAIFQKLNSLILKENNFEKYVSSLINRSY